MRKLISISLLSIMLSYSFNQIGIFAEYIMDIEQFTELYCKNKDKPELECNGKCHLADQLADNEEKKQTKEIQLSPEVLMIYANITLDIQKPIEFFVQENISYYYNTDLTEGIESVVFHPPQQKNV